MKKSYIYITALVMFLSSCYEDKGNYDYTPLGEVEINFTEDGSNDVTAVSLNQFVLEPIISTAVNKGQFTYEWILDEEVVSTDAVLDIILKLAPSSAFYYGELIITDGASEFKYSNQFKLTVESKIGAGWLILSEMNGKSALGFKSDLDNAFTQNIFEDINGRTLGIGPISMNQNQPGSYSPLSGGYLNILVDGGSKGAVMDRGSLVELQTVSDNFFGGGLPEGSATAFYNEGSELVIWNNKVLNTGDNAEIPGVKLWGSPSHDTSLEFAYLLHLGKLTNTGDQTFDDATGSWWSFSWGSLGRAPLSDFGAGAFPTVNSGFKHVAVGKYNESYFDTQILHIVKDGGVYTELKYAPFFGSYGMATESMRVLPGTDLPNDQSLYMVATDVYYYYTVGSKLYRRTHQNDDAAALVHTFDSDITCLTKIAAIDAADYTGIPFIVATYDGSGSQTGDLYFVDDNVSAFDIKATYTDVAGRTVQLLKK